MKETISIIEVNGGFARASVVAADHPSPVYTVRAISTCEYTPRDSNGLKACLEALLKAMKRFRPTQYLLLLDQALAATVTSNASLVRPEAETPITEADLDNLISRGIWNIFNRERAGLSRLMSVPEVNMQLTNAEVVKIMLDGHKVVSPIGFKAQRVDLWCRESVAAGGFLNLIYDLVPEEQITLIENTAGLLSSLLLTRTPETGLCAIVGPHETQLYALEQPISRYLDTIAWGSRTLLSAFSSQLGVSGLQAAQLIRLYERKEVSRAVSRKLEAIMSGELALLLKAMASHATGVRPLYIYSWFDMPTLLIDRAFHKRLGLSWTPTLVTTDFISKNFGYTLKLHSIDTGEYSDSSLLAVLTQLNRSAGDSTVAKLAKRRARWLTQSPNV